VRFFAEEARRAYGEVIPSNRAGRRLLALRQPVGVVGAITPWNFPALMIARKVAPAIAAGCPVVLKPASETPLSALALAELAARAGVPAGVLNVVHGDPVVVGSSPPSSCRTPPHRTSAPTLANTTESGLSAYFYTRDAGRMLRFGEGLEFGVVGVNTGAISYEGAPFGGMKQSGIGREGSHHGMDEFLELKYLCVDGIG
jgi:acyl-CoA reductase-like NAD-dependent aldehyde dehydrogenase